MTAKIIIIIFSTNTLQQKPNLTKLPKYSSSKSMCLHKSFGTVFIGSISFFLSVIGILLRCTRFPLLSWVSVSCFVQFHHAAFVMPFKFTEETCSIALQCSNLHKAHLTIQVALFFVVWFKIRILLNSQMEAFFGY